MGGEELQAIWCNHYLSFFRESIRKPPPGYAGTLSGEEIEENAQRLLREFRSGNVRKSMTTFVNCWYESEYESDAMWRLYSEQSRYAVAIQTTAGLLRKHSEERIVVGRVRYIDYRKTFPDISFPHFFKRNAFEHEREVRAAIIDLQSPPEILGKPVGVTLQPMIRAVRVSPRSPSWFLDLVQDVTRKYDLEVAVSVSLLESRPFR